MLIFLMRDNNTQKMITYNQTRLTVAVADLIIYEGISFNIAQKHRSEKVLDLERTVSKIYQPSNINLISKDILGVIHYQDMERNPILIIKEYVFFGLLFLGDGTNISGISLLNILVSGKIFQQLYQNFQITSAIQQMV